MAGRGRTSAQLATRREDSERCGCISHIDCPASLLCSLTNACVRGSGCPLFTKRTHSLCQNDTIDSHRTGLAQQL